MSTGWEKINEIKLDKFDLLRRRDAKTYKHFSSQRIEHKWPGVKSIKKSTKIPLFYTSYNSSRLIITSVDENVDYEEYLSKCFPKLIELNIGINVTITEGDSLSRYIQNSNLKLIVCKSKKVSLLPFRQSHPLEQIYVVNSFFMKNPEDVFSQCQNLEKLEIAGSDGISIKRWKAMYSIFKNTPSLVQILSHYNNAPPSRTYDADYSHNILDLVVKHLPNLIYIGYWAVDTKDSAIRLYNLLETRKVISNLYPFQQKNRDSVDIAEYIDDFECPNCKHSVRMKRKRIESDTVTTKHVKTNSTACSRFMEHTLMDLNVIPIILKYSGVLNTSKNVFLK